MTAMRPWLVTASIVIHVAVIRLASGFWEIERLEAEPQVVSTVVMLPYPVLTQPETREQKKRHAIECHGCVCDVVRWRRIEPDPQPVSAAAIAPSDFVHEPIPEIARYCIHVLGRIVCLPAWDTPAIRSVGGG